MEAMRQEINEIKINTDLINKSRNFKIKTKRPNVTKENLPPGRHTTTCLICNFTCHKNCAFANNEEKKVAVQWIIVVIVPYAQKNVDGKSM